MYCEDLHKPYFRGWLHAVMIGVHPSLIQDLSILGHHVSSPSLYQRWRVFSYTASALLHCGTYDPITENFLLKMDHTGIFVMIGCNFTPVAVSLLRRTGTFMICLMWTGIVVWVARIFYWKRTIWWESILVGATALLSLN